RPWRWCGRLWTWSRTPACDGWCPLSPAASLSDGARMVFRTLRRRAITMARAPPHRLPADTRHCSDSAKIAKELTFPRPTAMAETEISITGTRDLAAWIGLGLTAAVGLTAIVAGVYFAQVLPLAAAEANGLNAGPGFVALQAAF